MLLAGEICAARRKIMNRNKAIYFKINLLPRLKTRTLTFASCSFFRRRNKPGCVRVYENVCRQFFPFTYICWWARNSRWFIPSKSRHVASKQIYPARARIYAAEKGLPSGINPALALASALSVLEPKSGYRSAERRFANLPSQRG